MWVIYVGALTGILVLFWAAVQKRMPMRMHPYSCESFSGRQYGFAPVSKNR